MDKASAVISHTHWVRIRQLFVLDQILQANFHPVDPHLDGRPVDQAFEDEDSLGSPGTAIGCDGTSIGPDCFGRHVGLRDVVNSRGDRGASCNRHEGKRVTAEVSVIHRAHSKEHSIAVERQFRLSEKIAARIIAERHFASRPGPFHRTTYSLRRPGHKRELRIA